MVKYSLSEIALTERPDDYSALAEASGSYNFEAIINRMLSRGTLVTRTDIVAVLNNLFETIGDISLEGGTINLPIFNTSFSVSGVFDGPLDTFDGNRHKLNLNLTKGTLLRKVEKEVKLEKTNPSSTLPQIQEVKDSLSGTVNEQLTPKGVVELRGYGLKIEGDLPQCGLWFVNQDGADEKAELLIENKPSKILAMIPALPTGQYQMKVVTQHSGTKLLKTPKVFVFQKILTVNNG